MNEVGSHGQTCTHYRDEDTSDKHIRKKQSWQKEHLQHCCNDVHSGYLNHNFFDSNYDKSTPLLLYGEREACSNRG